MCGSYEHYQLVVAKRVDTESWEAINRGEAKVVGAVGVPAVGRKFFEDAQGSVNFHVEQAFALYEFCCGCCCCGEWGHDVV